MVAVAISVPSVGCGGGSEEVSDFKSQMADLEDL